MQNFSLLSWNFSSGGPSPTVWQPHHLGLGFLAPVGTWVDTCVLARPVSCSVEADARLAHRSPAVGSLVSPTPYPRGSGFVKRISMRLLM